MTPPTDGPPSNYRFADLTLDVARRCVMRHGQSIELKTLDFDLLRFLVEQAPNVVNPNVLAERVWGRHFVSPENVAQRIMLLRQSLADDANKPRYIETVRNKGYRLIPIVERALPEAPRLAPAAPADAPPAGVQGLHAGYRHGRVLGKIRLPAVVLPTPRRSARLRVPLVECTHHHSEEAPCTDDAL
jgi:DNA-binding winged helix-turn-helix (wHTH) protein